MPNFDASVEDVACVQCAVCEKAIAGGKWFARLRISGRMVALCCPLCTETFETNPRPYLRRIETYELMQDSRSSA